MERTKIQTPRDPNRTFESEIIPKRKTDVVGIQDKILALYMLGLSTREISESLSEIYGFEASHEVISNVTDQVIPHVKQWQQRPLKPVYPIVYLGCPTRTKLKNVKGAQNLTIYCIIGIDLEGCKDVHSISIGENESASSRVVLLNELKVRGVADKCIACVDGISGFMQAIQAVYPHTLVQCCLVN